MSAWIRVAMLVIGFTLAAPGSAAAQSQTRGSALLQDPNTFGCEVRPSLVSFSGDYNFFISGQPDCTWYSDGIYGDFSGASASGVPGDGRVTNIAVRYGPNQDPALLRFVVLQRVETRGGAGPQCCFFIGEREYGPFQPQPGGISNFPVSIPVQANTDLLTASRYQDFIGVSAVAGTGLLPLRSSGSHNVLNDYRFGNPIANFLYPRFGTHPDDRLGGRKSEQIPGMEVLLAYTWEPAAASAGTPSRLPLSALPGQPVGGQAIGATLANQTARVRNGRALVDLVCNGDVVCEGRLALLRGGARLAAAKKKKKKKATGYGQARYSVPAGGKATVKVKLNDKGKRLLGRKRSATVAVRLTPKSGEPVNATVILRR